MKRGGMENVERIMQDLKEVYWKNKKFSRRRTRRQSEGLLDHEV